MTTRAGLTGLLAGLIATLILYPLWLFYPQGEPMYSTRFLWLTGIAGVILATGSGVATARWSQAERPAQRAALGGLAGGLAGTVVFCLWGAAAAGATRWGAPAAQAVSQGEWISAITRQTLGGFLALFLGGGGCAAAGGWLEHPRRVKQEDLSPRPGPQMALNVAITAVPASIVAAALAAAIFPRLSVLLNDPTGSDLAGLPLVVSVLLVVVSHAALTGVIPYEARKVQHLCGIDEVKMAAYVSIGAAPVLIILLFLAGTGGFLRDCLIHPILGNSVPQNGINLPILLILGLLACVGLSLVSLRFLLALILPRRASFPAPQTRQQQIEARWFGTIATSRASQLAALCAGCGLAMVLPLYVSVFSVLINLSSAPPVSAPPKLFLLHALASLGLVAVAIVALTSIYLFYLNLGRWFRRWSQRS